MSDRAIGIKLKAKSTMLKYAINSLVATTADLTCFYFLVDGMHAETVFATFCGNTAGAIVSYRILHRWVFKSASPQKIHRKISKFSLGIAISTLSNMAFVTLLFYLFGWSAWPARIGAAIGAWFLGYWFNRKVVFKYHV